MRLPAPSGIRLLRGGDHAPADDHVAHAPVFEHEDPGTGRIFAVTLAMRETDDGMTKRFFLAEFCPTGQIAGADGHTVDSQVLAELDVTVGPNGFMKAAEEAGVEREQIVMVTLGAEDGCGFDVIEDALDTITACLAMNRRYNQFIPLEDKEALRMAARRREEHGGEDLMPDLRAWADRS